MSEPASTPVPIMEDFVFGRLEADETTLAGERKRWSGVRHQYAIEPLDPAPHQPVEITVSVGRAVLVDRVTVYVSTDGRAPAGERGAARRGFAIELQRCETRWQPLYWDYVDIWRGTIPGQPEGTHVRYRIEGWHSREPSISHWSREMNIDGTVERPTLYGYSVDSFETPAWAHEAIVYHIFVDRFAPAGDDFASAWSRWLEPAEMNDFIGGNLRGVIAKLDYIANLGATAIWLSPIFLTNTYHGYDTVDYYAIDPRFGAKTDLRDLVEQAHQRGLRVILDFVANHTSDEFPPFLEALHDPHSPKRQWYSFGPDYVHGYRTFFTARHMPQLDLENPDARAFLLDAARYWLKEFGIDGYRLDYAAGPSHDFWSAFYAACKQVKADVWLFGEVTLGSDWLRTYTGRLDGCLDFSFTRHIRRLCLAPAATTPKLTAFAAALARTQRFFPASFTRPTFLDNHDMNRFLWMAGNDKQRLRFAAALMLAFGGAPILYYGTEVGLSQPRSKGPHREESRHPMLWGAAQDAELLAYFQGLIAFRRRHPALVYGEITTLAIDDEQGVWLAERRHGGDRALIVVNASPEPRAVSLPESWGQRLVLSAVEVSEVVLEGRSVVLLD